MLSKRCLSSPAFPSARLIAALLAALVLLPGDSIARRRRRRKPEKKEAHPAKVDPSAGFSRVRALAGIKLPTSQPSSNFHGSMGSDVILEDVTNTLRLTFMRTITVSRKNPKVAYVGSYDGYVFKTTDGGKTWDESRLIVEPRPFYGDGGQRLYFGVHRRAGGSGYRSLPIGDTAVAGRNKLLAMRPMDVAFSRIRAGAGSRVGASQNSNFGIGLPGGAPRLQNLVRKFKKPTAGLNIKQTLYLRGVRPTEVRQIIIHPKHENIVYACTFFGLYMSEDGGLNWVRTFLGINPRGRIAATVAVDPSNDNNVMLATGNGVYVSSDGGQNYLKSTAQGVGGGFVNWIQFHPWNPNYVYACTDFGLLRSSDSGKTWDWIYFTTFPAARVVRYITIDPLTKKTAWIATHDGIFKTDDVLAGSLEDWKRVGGLRFTATEVWKVEANPKRSGHLWAITNMRLAKIDKPGHSDVGGAFLWESLDGGETWRTIFSGLTYGAIQWFDTDPTDPDLLWIVWSRGLHRMRRQQKRESRSEQLRQMRVTEKLLVDYPSQSNVIIAAGRFTGVEPSRQLGYRFRSRLKALVPRIDASYVYYRSNDYQVLHDGRFVLPYRFRSLTSYAIHDVRVMLTWNLFDLVFDLKASLFGRIDRINGEMRAYLNHAIHRFYGELLRLQIKMATRSPEDLRVRLVYKLRIQELESYIDLITGGYLTRWKKGDRPSPWDTPWFGRWPGVRREWFKSAK